jgi:hypothetical protein
MSATRVHFRVYEEEKAKLRERAASNGFSMSEYMRRLIEWEEREALRASVSPVKAVRTFSKRWAR